MIMERTGYKIKYKTEEEKKEAHRQNSRKYYEKGPPQLLSKKKLKLIQNNKCPICEVF